MPFIESLAKRCCTSNKTNHEKNLSVLSIAQNDIHFSQSSLLTMSQTKPAAAKVKLSHFSLTRSVTAREAVIWCRVSLSAKPCL